MECDAMLILPTKANTGNDGQGIFQCSVQRHHVRVTSAKLNRKFLIIESPAITIGRPFAALNNTASTASGVWYVKSHPVNEARYRSSNTTDPGWIPNCNVSNEHRVADDVGNDDRRCIKGA